MFVIRSYMNMKGKLCNDAFGGGWSEEMLDRERLRAALDALERAAEGYADEDMRSDELEDALPSSTVKRLSY